MDVMRKQAVAKPIILVAQVTKGSMDDYSDLVNDLQDAIEAIDEPGYQVTDDDLNRLYSAKDALAKWNPELEVK